MKSSFASSFENWHIFERCANGHKSLRSKSHSAFMYTAFCSWLRTLVRGYSLKRRIGSLTDVVVSCFHAWNNTFPCMSVQTFEELTMWTKCLIELFAINSVQFALHTLAIFEYLKVISIIHIRRFLNNLFSFYINREKYFSRTNVFKYIYFILQQWIKYRVYICRDLLITLLLSRQ